MTLDIKLSKGSTKILKKALSWKDNAVCAVRICQIHFSKRKCVLKKGHGHQIIVADIHLWSLKLRVDAISQYSLIKVLK